MNATVRPALPPAMTRDEFLGWKGHLDGRWEYDGVRPVPMTEGSRIHGRIMLRLARALLNRLDGTDWDVLGDVGLATVGNKVRYPDVQATREASPGTTKLIPGTVLVCEVVSPGSELVDRVEKVREYAAVPSIRYYVIVEQTTPVLTLLHRADAEGGWKPVPLSLGDALDLPELGISVPVDEIYAGLTFPPDDPERAPRDDAPAA